MTPDGLFADLRERPQWQDEGLCKETDPEVFYPEKGGSVRDGKLVCFACPVRAQCLQYALELDEKFGIWGGLSARERRPLKPGYVPPPVRSDDPLLIEEGLRLMDGGMRVTKAANLAGVTRAALSRAWFKLHPDDATPEAARRAHAAYLKCNREPWVIEGERAYQREKKRRYLAARALKEAAA
jgi:WhiB family redox-sensing transcriptional regulator